MRADLEILELDPVTGRRTDLASVVRRALRALERARRPYAVIGATALAVRGFPRMTRDLDVVVRVDDAFAAIDALERAGFRSVAPVDRDEAPEAMYVFEPERGTGEVDLLVAGGEPESTVIAEAGRTRVFGVDAPVASLEHLVLMYLYSNQPHHAGDFARVVTSKGFDAKAVERTLAEVHPEMRATFRRRLREARNPPPPPERPPARKRPGGGGSRPAAP